MAADYSFECQKESFERAVLPECLQRILAAGGSETAGRGSERGDAQLIEAYQQYEWEGDNGFPTHILLRIAPTSALTVSYSAISFELK